MEEVLYLEVPTPDTKAVKTWLQKEFVSPAGYAVTTTDGIRIEGLLLKPSVESGAKNASGESSLPPALSVVVWGLQRTTYLKVFRWAKRSFLQEDVCCQQLARELRQQFPPRYGDLPDIDLRKQTIFEALTPHYPKTVQYFQLMANGETELQRVYWWEKYWRDSVEASRVPKPVIFSVGVNSDVIPDEAALPFSSDLYDLVYLGGALGALQATVMAQQGYRVLVLERLQFEQVNRAWNISPSELQQLWDLGLFSPEELESCVAHRYRDGLSKFLDANMPADAQASVLHTPTVLSIALDSEALLKCCAKKLLAAGGEILDQTEFRWAQVDSKGVDVYVHTQGNLILDRIRTRILVDAMGRASPITRQFSRRQSFAGVCPMVGVSISGGVSRGMWDSEYGDVQSSYGDISRGRQLIWRLLPGANDELIVSLFHYHEVHLENPGSLLENYEDFFHILPEYRCFDLDKLTWRKPIFGYIPNYPGVGSRLSERFNRLVTLGDVIGQQSPLVFSGFGAVLRQLPGLTDLLDVALRNDLLNYRYLKQIHALQSQPPINWPLYKAMTVPTWQMLEPSQVNTILNMLFRILGQEPTTVAERFLRGQSSWLEFNRVILRTAYQNPRFLAHIWTRISLKGGVQWGRTYSVFTFQALLGWALRWLPKRIWNSRSWLENLPVPIFYWLLAQSYRIDNFGLPYQSELPKPNRPRRS